MCMRTTCKDCGKPDWSGCGAHIESVLGDVPAAQRCRCREDGTRPAPPSVGQWLSGIFSKKKG